MLCLDVGLWSGFKRKMELAESFGQPLITVSRELFYNFDTLNYLLSSWPEL
jgi:hypothetical protein